MAFETEGGPKATLTAQDLANLINANHHSHTLLLNEIRTDVNSCLSNLENHSARIEEAEVKLVHHTKEIAEANEKIKVIREDQLASNIQIELCLQRQFKNSFEIVGVPLSTGENVISLVISIIKLLDINLTELDINSCYRAGFTPRTLKNGQVVKSVYFS